MVTHPLWRPYQPSANARRQEQRVAHRQVQPPPLQEHQARWTGDFSHVRAVIERALGGRQLAIEHVGSTSVPDLVAKPVLDVDLTVADVRDESGYVPALEAVGFRLLFRDEIAGDAHRQLAYAAPNTNLHVWNPGAIEVRRHRLFVDFLRTHQPSRKYYAEAKRTAGQHPVQGRYNDLKSAAVYDIYELAFLADDRLHEPQPRR